MSDATPPAPPAPKPQGAGLTSKTAEVLEVENFIETYSQIAEWIRFADAKAAAVLTVNGALASVLIPTLKPYLEAAGVGSLLKGEALTLHSAALALPLVAFLFWLAALVLSCVDAFRCINPHRRNGRHPALDSCQHFHPAAIAHRYTLDDVEPFLADCQNLGQHGFKKEVLAGILVDSHISGAKYMRVTRSIKLLAVSALFGFLYMLTSQLL